MSVSACATTLVGVVRPWLSFGRAETSVSVSIGGTATREGACVDRPCPSRSVDDSGEVTTACSDLANFFFAASSGRFRRCNIRESISAKVKSRRSCKVKVDDESAPVIIDRIKCKCWKKGSKLTLLPSQSPMRSYVIIGYEEYCKDARLRGPAKRFRLGVFALHASRLFLLFDRRIKVGRPKHDFPPS